MIEFLKQSVQNYVTFIFLKAIKRIYATEIRVLSLINDQEKKSWTISDPAFPSHGKNHGFRNPLSWVYFINLLQ